MNRSATLGFGDLCRLELRRVWDPTLPLAAWDMLNPSIADAMLDDPTIGRVCHFSKKVGAGGAVVVNPIPFRATDPADMLRAVRTGVVTLEMLRLNMEYVERARDEAGFLFVACGVPKPDVAWHVRRSVERFTAGRSALCLGISPGGWPKHPLARGKHAIRNDFEPVPFAGLPL